LKILTHSLNKKCPNFFKGRRAVDARKVTAGSPPASDSRNIQSSNPNIISRSTRSIVRSEKSGFTSRGAGIHVQLRPLVKDRVDEFLRDAIAALIGVDNVRSAKPAMRLLKCVNRMNSLERYRHPVRQNPPAVHINHRRQIHKTRRHANVGRIQRPNLIAPVDRQFAQRVRKYLVLRVSGKHPVITAWPEAASSQSVFCLACRRYGKSYET
jgi:hypothetical protein